MLQTLTQAARRLMRRFAARKEVGVYQSIEADSLLLRSQKRVEAQRAIQRKEAQARRAARKAETEAREARAAAKAKLAEATQPEEATTDQAAASTEETPAPIAETAKAKPAKASKAKPAKASKAKKETVKGEQRTLFVTEQAAESKVNLEVDSGLVSDWMEEGSLLFVDVREVTELIDGHVEGALLMPQDAVEGRYQEIKKDQKTVIYCMSGARSLQVATLLRSRGYHDIWSMTGGFGSWVAQGGDYVTPPTDTPLKLAQSVRLSSRGRKRLSREEGEHGTVQEINGVDKNLRYTIAIPLEDGGVEWLGDLRRSDLAFS